MPLADGGEGTLEVLLAAMPTLVPTLDVVPGPRPDRLPVEARTATSGDGRLGVVELAEAAGLGLVATEDRDPERTGTAGVGVLLDRVRDRLRASAPDGPVEILLTLGGSATVDGGIGALRSLGIEVDGPDGPSDRPLVGGDLAAVRAVRVPEAVRRRWADVRLRVLVDVTNPLVGPTGAAPVFAPQKGADGDGVARLAAGLESWSEVLATGFGIDPAMPGAGAAGGIGVGLAATLGATLEPGFATIAGLLGLETAIAERDLVITSEGRLDATSFAGKVIGGVLGLADRHGVPVVVVPGTVAADLDASARFAAVRPLDAEVGPARARRETNEALRQATAAALRGLERSTILRSR